MASASPAAAGACAGGGDPARPGCPLPPRLRVLVEV